MDALAFDMYGTLCDPRAVTRSLAAVVEDVETVSETWRRKQLEYSFMVSMMDRYENFWQVTRHALDYALESAGVALSETEIEKVMGAYRHLDPFADAENGLRQLQAAGFPMAILSNGSPDMLRDLTENAGIARYFDAVLSADAVRIFKPHSRVYRLAAGHFDRPIGETWLVSSNSFDAVGAKAAGMRVAWVNRTGTVLDKVGDEPDVTVDSLVELAHELR